MIDPPRLTPISDGDGCVRGNDSDKVVVALSTVMWEYP